MSVDEVSKLVKRLRKQDMDGDEAEPLLKELVLGAAVNLARIADALDKEKP